MLFNIVEVVLVALMCCLASVYNVHRLQMLRYQAPAYRHWLAQSHRKLWRENVIWAIVGVALKWYLPVFLSMFIKVVAVREIIAQWLTLLVFAGATGFMAYRDYHLPSPKPFVVTHRVQRLYGVMLLISVLCAAAMSMLSIPPYFLFAGMSYVVLLAVLIITPYENHLNAGFYESARKKIARRKDLITIGITGSCGKTQVKFILKALLSEKYNVLATPASFNTAMGISRVINDELQDTHEVFIAEMGATHVGDIRELVQLVRPKYGIVTNIGTRHMDTFGSQANIAGTKYELVQGLPEDGVAIFGSGDDYISRLYAKCNREKYFVSLDESPLAYMTARVVNFGPRGTSFFMECINGEKVKCRMPLLGDYSVKDALLAAALAHRMGVTMDEIARGLKNVQPMEHRMQLVNDGEVITIDNSGNEDQDGAFEAVRVLSQMPGRRIVLTPGLKIGGDKDIEANYAWGTIMADCVDAVILVGERNGLKGLLRGLMQTGFPRENILMAADMEEGEALLHTAVSKGDTVLFEGRIPEYEDM